MNPKVEWFLKRPPYQRALMLLGVVLLVVALFAWLLILPERDDLVRFEKKNADLQKQIDKDSRVAANLPIYKAEYEKMLEKLDSALTELPNGKEIPTLLTSISSTAKANGLDVLTFKPSEEVPKGFYAEVPVMLKLEGTFHEVANFFYKVGSLPRIVNVNNVKIGVKRASAKDSTAVTLTVDCLATTFRFIENTAETAGAGKGAPAARNGRAK